MGCGGRKSQGRWRGGGCSEGFPSAWKLDRGDSCTEDRRAECHRSLHLKTVHFTLYKLHHIDSQRVSALSPPGSPLPRQSLRAGHGPAATGPSPPPSGYSSPSHTVTQLLPRQVPGHLPSLLYRRVGIRDPSSGLMGSQRAVAKGRFPEQVEISVSWASLCIGTWLRLTWGAGKAHLHSPASKSGFSPRQEQDQVCESNEHRAQPSSPVELRSTRAAGATQMLL